jgi:hypothetical protein
LLRAHEIDYKQFKEFEDWDHNYERRSLLDPEWKPEHSGLSTLLDELHDVNYHDLATQIKETVDLKSEVI